MGPHVETVCQFGMIHHQYLQAEASQSHLTALAVATNRRMPLAARARLVFGSALQALGSRILDSSHIESRPVMVTTESGIGSVR
jgi:hypothetical protein